MIRIAMVGSGPRNGHPYSWSAIINGYEPKRMAESPYPRIAAYLAAETTPGLSGARVTHIWSADRTEAEQVARTCRIEHVVDDPTAVVGQVDAVIIPTDNHAVHYEIAAPYLRAGLPVFVDKPLALNAHDLERFAEFARIPGRLMSCSAVRFSPKLLALRRSLSDAGTPVLVQGLTRSKWSTYGVHLVEAVVRLFPDARPRRVWNVATGTCSNVVVEFDTELEALLVVHAQGAPVIKIGVCGTAALVEDLVDDWFAMFREMLRSFLTMVQTGRDAIPYDETMRIVGIVMAAEASAAAGGACVELPEGSEGGS